LKTDLTENIINGCYKLYDKIAESDFGAVFRGLDIKHNAAVAIKILPMHKCRPENIDRLRLEAEILSRLNHTHIVRILDTGKIIDGSFGLSCYIVMEYVEGKSLDRWNEEFNPSLNERLSVIKQIADTLDLVHSKKIIHCDLKPANIMIVGNTDLHMKLLDFGLARIKDPNTIESDEKIRGTFQYMSPEQIGLIRRNVDERSDLYSLGIIFYQLLTGHHPFRTESLSMLLHEQIARKPEPPSRIVPEILPIIDTIILKLLAQDPDNRYRSAIGLSNDLKRLLSGDTEFMPDELESNSSVHLSSQLIGREPELKQLKKALSLARKGKGSVCLIAGEPGIGKTRLLDEFRRFVITENITIVEGRCIERDSKTPWGLFRDSLGDYLNGFSRHDPDKKAVVCETMQRTCKDIGKIIVNLYPAAQAMLGNCSEPAKLSPDQESIRTCLAATRFTYTLSLAEGVMVVLLDDLQWSDNSSLMLLKEIARNISDQSLLIIGAYRNNEVDEKHELYTLIRPDEKRYAAEHLIVNRFDDKQIQSFISCLLNTDASWLKRFSGYIYKRSMGNPFYSRELITYLISEGLLFKNIAGWSFDFERMENNFVSEDMIDILLKRIDRLAQEDINILCMAAVIGKRFDIWLLLNINQEQDSTRRVTEALNTALAHQIIEENFLQPKVMVFAHDRIREAFYKRLSSDERKALHLKIGRAMEEMHSTDTTSVLFDLAYHYMESGHDESIMTWAYPAARRANAEYAYDDAIKYLLAVYNILAKKSKPGEPDWLECTRYLAETYLQARKCDEALSLLNMLLPHMTERVKQASIYLCISKANLLNGDYRKAETSAKTGLKLIGEWLPVNKIGVITGLIREICIHLLFHMLPGVFLKKDTQGVKEEDRLKTDLLYALFPVYNIYEMWKLPRTVLRRLNISEFCIGPSYEQAFSLVQYSVICGILRLYKRAFAFTRRAAAINRKLNDERLKFYIYLNLGFLYGITGKYQDSIKCEQGAFEYFRKTREFIEFYSSAIGLSMGKYELSEFREVVKLDALIQKAAMNKSDEMLSSTAGFAALAYICSCDFDLAEKRLKKYCDMPERTFEYCLTNIWLGKLFLEKGDIEQAIFYLKIAHKADRKNEFMRHLINEKENLFTEALLRSFQQTKHALTEKNRKKELKKIGKYCNKALKQNKHFPNLFGGTLKVNAEYYAISGNIKKAEDFFKLSIAHHKNYKQRYKQARAGYAYGCFLKDTGKDAEAVHELESAYSLFDETDVPFWKKRVAKALGLKEEKQDNAYTVIDKQRKEIVLTFGKAVADCRGLNNMMELVMQKALEITGAQAGGLFLSSDDFNAVELKTWQSINPEQTALYSMTIVDKVFQSGLPVITTNAEADAQYAAQDSVVRNKLKSVLCVPVQYNDLINGVCYLYNLLAEGVFSEKDVKLLDLLLSQAAIAIENALLNEKLAELSLEKPIRVQEARQDDNLQKIIDYIDNHFDQDVSRETLSGMCGLNPDYLGKRFKSQTGKSINDYVNECRIRYAADKLSETDKKVIDIAFDAGFESLRTFNRIFFRIMGDTPTKYREKSKIQKESNIGYK